MPGNNPYLTVSDLNSNIRRVVEGGFSNLKVRGEISNFHLHPTSGHMYFTLKDIESEIRCVMFRGNNIDLKFKPGNGIKVLLKGSLTIYEQRGQIQLRVLSLSPEGDGDLFLAYELLKRNLQKEGLFDEREKSIIPRYPKVVGIVTSITSAAFQDIIDVIYRRAPHLKIILRSVTVQGRDGSKSIVRGINDLNKYGNVDIMILARGGGSIEDLWCFNEENVARAIYASKIPIISGVGHETDFTISDFTSDLRAPTPSAAAELVSIDRKSIIDTFNQFKNQLQGYISKKMEAYQIRLDYLENRLSYQQPGKKIQIQSDKIFEIQIKIINQMKSIISNKEKEVYSFHKQLLNLGPKNVLKRGYSIVFKEDAKTILRSSEDISSDEIINVKLASGAIVAKNLSKKPKSQII